MKCNQTKKVFRNVKWSTLSEEDGGPIKEDIRIGDQLLMDYSGKSYPVTVLTLEGTNKL